MAPAFITGAHLTFNISNFYLIFAIRYTELAITKLDVLDQLPELKVAVAYKYEGQVLDSFPANMNILEKVEVEYVTFPGWMQTTSECRNFELLPENAKKYVKYIQDFLQVPGENTL